MRVILHIGMPKTGSSALQRAFVATRGRLRKKGILYPRGIRNHNFLLAGLVSPNHIGRFFSQRYEGDHEAVRADFAKFWRNILQAVERHGPSVVVLSAEYLFGPVGHSNANLRTMLAQLGGPTEVVCYVRRPSDYYLSMVQQRLKAAWDMQPAGPVYYRQSLEGAIAAADTIHVIRYDRSLFPKGDIVADFASRFIPEATEDLCAVADPNANSSMSAEAMDIVQAFRRELHPDENDRFTHDTGMLRRRLAQCEVELGGIRRPELLPHVREIVDQSSVDLIWLRDTFGIVFDGIEYDSIGPARSFHPKAVGDICVLDPERRAALAAAASMRFPIDPTRTRPKPRTVSSRRSKRARRVSSKSMERDRPSDGAPRCQPHRASRFAVRAARADPKPSASAGALLESLPRLLSASEPGGSQMQVFVVGAPRSGTTRVKTALSDALGLPRSAEGHFYPVLRDLDLALNSYFDRVCPSAGQKTMIQAVDREDLRKAIRAVIRRTFVTVASPSFVEKTPGTGAIVALPMVVEEWPEAKIVFTKRRGIENVISALWKFPDATFEASCRGWAEAMAAWAALGPDVKSSSIEIDQAVMAREPEKTAARLGAFLGLSEAATAGVAEAFGQRAHPRSNSRVSSMEELQRDPIPLAETPWSEEQRATFVAICGDMMRAYCYRLD